jgi:hypothetical protein
MRAKPARARAAKEAAGQFAPPPPDRTPPANLREAYILYALRGAAHGSPRQRQQAIDHLNGLGHTDDEISAALHAETRRLEEYRGLLKNPPGTLTHREYVRARTIDLVSQGMTNTEAYEEATRQPVNLPLDNGLRVFPPGETPPYPVPKRFISGPPTVTFEVDDDTADRMHAKDINTYSIGDGSYTLEEPARNIPIPRDETRPCTLAPWCNATHHHPDCPIAGVK